MQTLAGPDEVITSLSWSGTNLISYASTNADLMGDSKCTTLMAFNNDTTIGVEKGKADNYTTQSRAMCPPGYFLKGVMSRGINRNPNSPLFVAPLFAT